MRESILKNTAKACCVIFCVLLAVHAFEAIVLRTDETFFGENFINKLFGILILWLILRTLQWKWRDVGFSERGFARNLARGFLLAAAVFSVAYAVEFLVLKGQGHTVRLDVFTTGFSLTGAATVHRGAGFILMCVFFNVINVIMEEGTFRGLFYELLKTDRSVRAAVLIQALLFGVWHVVTPLHNLVDGELDVVGFAGLSIGYIILAGIMGVKWALMYRMTGSLYAGMADHFFNNCIATNLLHLSTESGTDELMLVRVLIAQLLSFFVVLAARKTRFREKDGSYMERRGN
ncbi:MAG: CPBP family intramembrane metalloprotease [Oscillospiraceae bacterium]|nr:CPBP family intramembrane metalloprotease [Oscillospiraceae bacterium]